jgi:hypothetical protein
MEERNHEELSRAEELGDLLQDVALGKKTATDDEVTQATKELDELLPDAHVPDTDGDPRRPFTPR